MFDSLLESALDILRVYGIKEKFWDNNAGYELIQSAKIVLDDKEDAFVNGYELASYLLEGMLSVFKEESLEKQEVGYHSTADGRLITSVVASQDGLQEEALHLIQTARGSEVVEIYQEVLQGMNLHCPTCTCDTEITTYDELIEKRESYLNKLKDVLGKQE